MSSNKNTPVVNQCAYCDELASHVYWMVYQPHPEFDECSNSHALDEVHLCTTHFNILSTFNDKTLYLTLEEAELALLTALLLN
jgi:hypothetical protein